MKNIFIGLIFVFIPAVAVAQTAPVNNLNTVSLYWENDNFFGTDRDYTNGLKITWSTPYFSDTEKTQMPGWGQALIPLLPFMKEPGQKRALSFSLGQNIFTPEDTQRSDIIIEDRPYAGHTYAAMGFHSIISNRKHTWEVNLGIVGPHSYAGDIQDAVHNLIGSELAQGWPNQLADELGLGITFETQWRLFHKDIKGGFSYDFIPHLGGSLGNIKIQANGGAEVRFGWNLPKNFGTCPIRAGCETNTTTYHDQATGLKNVKNRVGGHLFAAVDGRVVLRDIYLDGNTFVDSHSVEKEPFMADLIAGVSLEYKQFEVSYSYIYRTKQFKTQKESQVFGALNVSVSY